jgi:hypothetical protein
MTIDQDAEPDTNVSATEVDDSAVDTGSDQDSQETSTQSPEGASATSAPADKAVQPDAGDGSSTTPDTTLQAAETPAVDPRWATEKAALEKRIADLRSQGTRASTQLDHYKKRYADVDPDKYRELVKHNDHSTLPVWDPRNPGNGNFRQAYAAWERQKGAISKARTPEQRTARLEALDDMFDPAEAKQLQAFEEHQRRESARLASDPMAYREQIRQEAVDAVRQEMRAAQEEQQVVGWFENPANQPIIDQYRAEMVDKINQGYPWGMIKEWVELKAKADGLQSRVGGAEKASASARAQTSALKSNAAQSVSRDPATKPIEKTDFWKEAKKWADKHKLPYGHEKVATYLDDLVKRSRNN